ncbi:MAG: hypothetical protein ACREDR_10375 [Blastocatellia bacterium]
MTPLDLIASVLIRYPDLHPAAKTLFDAYDEFLLVLNDKDKRKRLEVLAPGDAGSDSLFQHLRELGHSFQKALTDIFLEPNSSRLHDLTKAYGVF